MPRIMIPPIPSRMPPKPPPPPPPSSRRSSISWLSPPGVHRIGGSPYRDLRNRDLEHWASGGGKQAKCYHFRATRRRNFSQTELPQLLANPEGTSTCRPLCPRWESD